jgi:hypothetical protein
MIKSNDKTATITCDKCGATSTALKENYNDRFFDEGWALHKGRKYEHLCRKCLRPSARKAMDFVKKKFFQSGTI